MRRFSRVDAKAHRFKVPRDSSTPQPIWATMRDAWTVRDEKDFSAWYKAKVSTQFLQGSGLDVDCAEPQGFCDWNNYQCSLADFLYSKHNMIDNLRDDPSVPYARRFEF